MNSKLKLSSVAIAVTAASCMTAPVHAQTEDKQAETKLE